MTALFRLSIATKVYLLITFFIAASLGAAWVSISMMERNTYALREAHLKDVVDTARSQLVALQAQVEAGEMTLEEAKAEGANRLAHVRYSGTEYMFASDYQANVTSHPRDSLLGSNQWELEDKNGQKIYQEGIALVQSGPNGGAFYYVWNRGTTEGSEQFETKMSYVLPFEPWGWMVGTGTFVTDIEAMTAQVRNTLVTFMGLGIAAIIVIGGILAVSISRPVKRLKTRMHSLSEGNYDDPVPYTKGRTEMAQMAQSILVFRDAMKSKAELEAKEEAAREARDADMKMQQDIVAELAEGLNGLASGNLQVDITTAYSGLYEKLRLDFNQTVDTLRDLIGNIIAASSELERRSRGINDSAQRVAVSSERSAATLEETAAALEELTNTVNQAAKSAEDVDGIVQDAQGRAATSGTVVDQAVGAMNEIEDSSKEISKITSVIDDIAFQTNLLALNAGVEAARAGESGQGFAVVASEVRALAGRASEAASEIKSLITASGDEVSRGSELVDGAGKALGEIAESVSQISGHVANITSGAKEQSVGLSEINNAMADLDRSTQQNSAMFQETLSESEILTRKAVELAQCVSHFSLDGAEERLGSQAA